jgi:hypothetical protein
MQRYARLAISGADKHPQIVDTTTTKDAAGNTTTNRNVVDSGYSDAMFQNDALGVVGDDPEHGAYQAATSYMSIVEKLLGAPG